MNRLSHPQRWHGEDALVSNSRNQLPPQQRPSIPTIHPNRPSCKQTSPCAGPQERDGNEFPWGDPPLHSLCSHPWLITASLSQRRSTCPAPPANPISLQISVPPRGLGSLIFVVVGVKRGSIYSAWVPRANLGAPKQGTVQRHPLVWVSQYPWSLLLMPAGLRIQVSDCIWGSLVPGGCFCCSAIRRGCCGSPLLQPALEVGERLEQDSQEHLGSL